MTELLAYTFDIIGKITLGLSVILVHRRMRKEHRIDRKVLRELRKEQSLAIIGILLMVVGYVLHLTKF